MIRPLMLLKREFKASFAILNGEEYKLSAYLPNIGNKSFTISRSHTINDFLNEIQLQSPDIQIKHSYSSDSSFKATIEQEPIKVEINDEEYEFSKNDSQAQSKPEYAEAYFNKGNLLFELKRMEEAIEAYSQAIKIDPDFIKSHYNKGVILSGLGLHKDSVHSFDEVIRINPNYISAYYQKINSLILSGKKKEAISVCDDVISINPYDSSTYYQKGILLDNIGNFDEAIECFDASIEIEPNNPIFQHAKLRAQENKKTENSTENSKA
ncbi:unnamed protein product [Blepharisma stoltei]|uniref:Tetratricopeptide repeat protein n=1 Tax=Blepharisma stoltei TaxID=1481888 RepID=A0AAU9K2S3_9CILI|nr:unnamed protein product [Blepharisma stoltei]